MTATTALTTDRRPASQQGPPLAIPVFSFAALTVAAAVVGASTPRPDAGAADVLAYDQAHPVVMGIVAALLLGAALPLAVTAATTLWRMRRLGVSAPGPVMGAAGGVLAAAAIALSAVFSWTAAQVADLGDAPLARALTSLSFATGGPFYAAAFGLFVAGIAVPALLLRLLPRPLAWAGLVVAVLAMLSVFSLATPVLYPLIPVGRFGGLLFLVVAVFVLPTSRRADR